MSKTTVNTEGLIAVIVVCIMSLLLAAHLFARFSTGMQTMNADQTKQNTNQQAEQSDQDELDALDRLAEHYDTSFWNAI
jgi:hypothetical protein